MSNKYVLDASALLALINNEPGAKKVEEALPNVILSSVNFAEILTTLCSKLLMPSEEAVEMIYDLVEEIVPFEAKQALLVAELNNSTKKKGLSLGDRACLALGKSRGLPIMTSDKIWAELKLEVSVTIIR